MSQYLRTAWKYTRPILITIGMALWLIWGAAQNAGA